MVTVTVPACPSATSALSTMAYRKRRVESRVDSAKLVIIVVRFPSMEKHIMELGGINAEIDNIIMGKGNECIE